MAGILLTIVFFLLVISVFVTIINNGLNNSSFYTPKKSVDQVKIRSRLALFYMILFFGVFVFTAANGNSRYMMALFVQFMFRDFLILFILIVRLSRVSIIPGLWKPVRLEFPVSYKKRRGNDFRLFGLTIKGESYNDYHISLLYEEDILVVPMSSRKSYLNKIYKGVIEKKLYLNEEPVFMLKVFLDPQATSYKYFLLITKKDGLTHSQEKYPIASINSVKNEEKNEMIFHEWVILKKAM